MVTILFFALDDYCVYRPSKRSGQCRSVTKSHYQLRQMGTETEFPLQLKPECRDLDWLIQEGQL